MTGIAKERQKPSYKIDSKWKGGGKKKTEKGGTIKRYKEKERERN